MPYQNELQFLQATLTRCRVHTQLLPEQDLPAALGVAEPSVLPLAARARYQYTDPLGRCYLYLRLPQCADTPVLLVGPYLTEARKPDDLLAALPHLEAGDSLFSMLDTFCEHIWQTSSFSVVDVNRPAPIPTSPIHQPLHHDRYDDVLLRMQDMERRYAFENELIESVRLGQSHKHAQLFSAVSQVPYEKRVEDPVRNSKNYCIIMNTLLRKAAEDGGVHPLYIDRVSSDFAKQIEQLRRPEQTGELMQRIYLGYCALVQQHTMQDYCTAVRTAILLIDSDLSANLTLHSLAQHQGLSPGYLSDVFKKETGQTITAYVRKRRMQHARHLLRSTDHQIGTVALHCGIPDVHYFTKLFKKETGMTPGQYRESGR